MPQTEPKRIGVSIEVKPHAYDPRANPELFEGVLARRVVAFLIDLHPRDSGRASWRCSSSSSASSRSAWAFLFLRLLSPAIVLWALFYYGLTFGSPRSATIGMRVMDIEMRTWYGAPAYFVLGAVHAVVFWLTVSVLTPLSCWSAFSTNGAGCCTTCWSAPS